MGLLSGLIGSGGATAKTNGALIKDSDTQHFMADVIQASRDQPVIVDFWAPWCGPCKQLTPLLERVVNNAGGKVRLVKINIDENPELAQQLRIQSIPTVYGFRGGQPVDGFAGALPESQIKAFVERLTGPLGPAPAELALDQAKEAAAAGQTDRGGAHLRAAARARAGQSRGAGRARPLPDCARTTARGARDPRAGGQGARQPRRGRRRPRRARSGRGGRHARRSERAEHADRRRSERSRGAPRSGHRRCSCAARSTPRSSICWRPCARTASGAIRRRASSWSSFSRRSARSTRRP